MSLLANVFAAMCLSESQAHNGTANTSGLSGSSLAPQAKAAKGASAVEVC